MANLVGTKFVDFINGTGDGDSIFGLAGKDRLLGHGGNDTIHGGEGEDIIEGGAGDDLLFADSNDGGEDILFGGADSDILVSGSGRDHLHGGSGIDAASWQEANSRVSADIDTGRAYSGGVRDTFSAIENLIGSRFGDSLYGDEGRNELFGAGRNDFLSGRGGNDHLSGGDGNDRLDGGAGFNSLKGGAGIDMVDYRTTGGSVEVDLRAGYGLGIDRHESLDEIENVRGSNFNDLIDGDTGSNLLLGMGGNDIINGDSGNDTLTGGSGADLFVFKAGTRGRSQFDSGDDRITDFDHEEGDVIDLRFHVRGPETFEELKSQSSQLGRDLQIRIDSDDTIVLEDFAFSELNAEMFLL